MAEHYLRAAEWHVGPSKDSDKRLLNNRVLSDDAVEHLISKSRIGNQKHYLTANEASSTFT